MSKKVIEIKLVTIIAIILLIIIAILGVFILKNKNLNENKNEIQNQQVTTNNMQNTQNISQNNIASEEEFPLEFLRLENNEQNMIYSPLSIKYALKMLSEGANGNTKTQIDNLVGRLNLTKYENIDKVLSFANGVYIRDTYSNSVKENFINTLIQRYNSEVNYDSFENADNVNNWIEEKTLGIIKKMLSDDMVRNPECKMLLINALAIDMSWNNPFDMNDTYGKSFYLDDGKEIKATTMNMETKSDSVSYYKDKNVTALTINLQKYEDTQLEFMAIMPEETTLNEYIQTLKVDEIDNITTKLTSASKTKYGVDISIPKFSFEYDLNLKGDLISLGITDAFDERVADFTNISDTGLYVSDALHKADIEFTEEGVKAAAVTVFVTKDTAAIIEQNEPEKIEIDKPFLFLIRDKETNEIWFVGTVYEPNLWEEDKEEYVDKSLQK